ncbi:MAG: PAAR domain-containing protein [candidate division Zixibacteria bacterium]|nr:PAAR domain-containing protein [candidate division Zixibacteria bacterium]
MPGKPAARLGDQTAHGGAITGPGVPTVLIGGMPACVMGDMHVCPMVNPGTPPPPHVGMNIIATGMTVLIGGKPSARLGDTAICAGPPATIVMGCMTVLIGDGGGGGGGAGSGGDAASQTEDSSGGSGDEQHRLDVSFVDKSGKPVTGVAYKVKLPDGNEVEGKLTGRIQKGGLKEGSCEIELKAIIKAEWSEPEARVGDKLKLSAEAVGVKDGVKGEFQIYMKDFSAADKIIDTIKADLSGGKIEGEWEYQYPQDEEDDSSDDQRKGYSHPKYYFIAKIENAARRSDYLYFKDYIEVRLKNSEGNAIGNKQFRLFFDNGEIKTGTLGSNGYKKVENVPPGRWSVDFPEMGPVTKATD